MTDRKKYQVILAFQFLKLLSGMLAIVFFYWSYWFHCVIWHISLQDSFPRAAFNYLSFVLCLFIFTLSSLIVNHPEIITEMKFTLERAPKRKTNRKSKDKRKDKKKSNRIPVY